MRKHRRRRRRKSGPNKKLIGLGLGSVLGAIALIKRNK